MAARDGGALFTLCLKDLRGVVNGVVVDGGSGDKDDDAASGLTRTGRCLHVEDNNGARGQRTCHLVRWSPRGSFNLGDKFVTASGDAPTELSKN